MDAARCTGSAQPLRAIILQVIAHNSVSLSMLIIVVPAVDIMINHEHESALLDTENPPKSSRNTNHLVTDQWKVKTTPSDESLNQS